MVLAASPASPSSRADDPTVVDVLGAVRAYHPQANLNLIQRAFVFAEQAHRPQRRKNGDPYIGHPVSVARIVAQMKLDEATICAALLHDTVEDTPATAAQLTELFGEEISHLVDGVTKLNKIRFRSKEERQAESFRKMLIAMSRDIRVILVKLADRCHNMRTLKHLPEHKQKLIAGETMDIFAPLANRLGLGALKVELEDLSFRYLYPEEYAELRHAVDLRLEERREYIERVIDEIRGIVADGGIVGEVHGRPKHFWSIHKKMIAQKIPFAKVYDHMAFRVLVDKSSECYHVLGLIHDRWRPIPGRFKDYIAIPKANGYQSLHTILFGPHGIPIEVQIRTTAMDQVAETGIAAHWHYKSGDEHSTAAQRRAHEWLRTVMDLQHNTGNALEFMENVKVDLFPDEVYVFTPRGEIMELPRGATGLDFAYAVHTDIGNSCVAIKIDRHLAPLSTPLQSGQTVEVITAKNARPRSAWLNYVITAKARHNIRNFLKNIRRQEAVEQGRLLLENALAQKGYHEPALPANLPKLLDRLNYKHQDDLFFDIGTGERLPAVIAAKLLSASQQNESGATESPLIIQGAEGMVLSFAKCCTPIPGDPIVGTMSAGKGIVIHRGECANVRRVSDSGRIVSVEWSAKLNEEFPAGIRLVTRNERGVLAHIASTISSQGANISGVTISEEDSMASTIHMVVDVRNRKHLADILRRLRHIPAVVKLMRVLA